MKDNAEDYLLILFLLHKLGGTNLKDDSDDYPAVYLLYVFLSLAAIVLAAAVAVFILL